jgi:hypothetical protein
MTKSLSNVIKGTYTASLPASGNAGNFLISTPGGWISSTLPTANTTTLGVVKVDGTTIIANNGVISGASTYTLPTANTTTLGGVIVDGTTIIANNGVISANSSGGASATKTIANKTAAYTVVAGDLGKIINCTSGTFTVSLTGAATLGTGFTCTIWNTSATVGDAITIDPNLTETIDGKTTLILRRGEGLDIVCDGTNWQIDNKKPMRGYAENIDSASNAIAMGNGAVAIGVSYVNASGSFAAGIFNNTSSYGALTVNSMVIGYMAKSYGNFSATFGYLATGGGTYGAAIGYKAYSNAEKAMAFGQSKASEFGKITFGPHTPFSTVGDLQTGSVILSASTTTTTTVALTSNGAGLAANYNQLIVTSDQAMTFFGTLIAKQSASAKMASYLIKGAIVNNAGTVSISTISIDKIIDTIGLTTEPTYTADNTNKALTVTSGAKATTNIRWVCNLDSVEVTYA